MQTYSPAHVQYALTLREAANNNEKQDFRGAADKRLAAVLMAPNVWTECRWEAFTGYSMMLLYSAVVPAEADLITLQHRFVENEEEPIAYRLYASYALAFLKADIDEDEAIRYCKQSLRLAGMLSKREGRRQIVDPVPPEDAEESTGLVLRKRRVEDVVATLQTRIHKLLEALNDAERKERKAEEHKEFQADPEAAIVRACQKRGMPEEIAREFTQAVFGSGTDFAGLSRTFEPPKISSELLEQVASLPVRNTVFFIRHDKKLDQMTALKRAVEFGGTDDRDVIRVFSVDLQRFQAGKTNKVFSMVNISTCDPRETRYKHILGAYAHACIKPGCRPWETHQEPGYRPMRVLVQTAEDADHAHVASFLSMMGCSDVSGVDPALEALLVQSWSTVVTAKGLFDYDVTPHLSDMSNGIKCFHCSKIGPTLKKCPCGKAYFCDNECMREKWSQHKMLHKATMAKKKAKRKESD